MTIHARQLTDVHGVVTVTPWEVPSKELGTKFAVIDDGGVVVGEVVCKTADCFAGAKPAGCYGVWAVAKEG